jgi:hypothetical protein
MTDENLQDASPAEGAPALPDADAEQVASPTTTDEATESPPADDAGEEAKPKGVGKRIDELTRNWREAERREAALLAMLQERQAPKAAPEPVPQAPAKMPALADFEYDEGKYQAALVEFTRAEARREAENVLKAERERQAAEQRAKSWAEKEAEYAKAKPDYREKVTDPSLPISRPMAQVIQQSEIGPDVAYYLADNRELAAQIATLPVEAAALALGRIEGRLLAQREAAQAAPRPVVSKAPTPPPRIEASAADLPVRTTDASGDRLSDDEWFKAEHKRLMKKRN